MELSGKVIVGPVCEITCFEQKKVARIRAELAKEEDLLPRLAELYKLLGNDASEVLLALAQEDGACVTWCTRSDSRWRRATSHQFTLQRDQAWLAMGDDGKKVYYRLRSKGILKALQGGFRLLEERLV